MRGDEEQREQREGWEGVRWKGAAPAPVMRSWESWQGARGHPEHNDAVSKSSAGLMAGAAVQRI